VTHLRVTPLSRRIGAVVHDVALASMDDATFATVHAALLERGVLFFPTQHLTDDEHLALAERWGRPMVFPVARLMGGRRALSEIVDDADSPPDADLWHTDITWWPEPPKVAVLAALDVPASGGDTMWADLRDAYASLSEPMRRLCEGLSALHVPGERFVAANRRIFGEEVGRRIEAECRGAVMPLVRTHEETGEQALWLSSFIAHLVDVHPAESALLLGHLQALLDDPNRTVRWRWTPGDVAIWDERTTNHRALADHYPQYRRMRRCVVEGPGPVFRPAGADAPTIVTRPAA
jgi:alpha-ketoglutarate-dependent taurine dioxygenase